MFSEQTKTIIWGELTCPSERRMQISAIIKTGRYWGLETELRSKGWKVHAFTWEVSRLGFPADSARFFFSKLGFPKHQIKHLLQRIGRAVRRSSYYIWNARHSSIWRPPPLYDHYVANTETIPTNRSLRNEAVQLINNVWSSSFWLCAPPCLSVGEFPPWWFPCSAPPSLSQSSCYLEDYDKWY